jgi:capsular polysaccharide biosynthesis protein
MAFSMWEAERMSRILEIILRHAKQLILLLVVPTLIGIAIAVFVLPPTYQAKATLWALRIYRTDTSNAATNLQATPGGTQAAALSELLQTRVFVVGIAEAAGIGATAGSDASSNSGSPSDAQVNELSQQIHIAAQGDNLVGITYSNSDPHLAQRVVQAVVQQYGEFIVTQGTSSPSTATAFFNVLDAPALPIKPDLRARLLLGGGVGVALGVLATLLYAVILARRDHAVYDSQDVQNVAGLPVIMQLSTLSPATVSLSAGSVGRVARGADNLDGSGIS